MTVIDPEKVADLLIVYRRTFFDRLVDDFVARYVGGSPQNETRREDSTTSLTEPE
jgi:hypothetical protein